jgi:hypothetical protein
LVDGLSGAEVLGLAAYLDFAATEADAALLADLAAQNAVVPPQVKASGLVRDAVARRSARSTPTRSWRRASGWRQSISTTAGLRLPLSPGRQGRRCRGGRPDRRRHARHDVRAAPGQDHGARVPARYRRRAANLFIPGATVAKLAIVKGLELHEKRRAAKAPCEATR